MEFNLLQYLMSHAGLPLSHARLLRAVWGCESANQVGYLRTYMLQLRRKLEDDPGHPRYLLTHSHVGYRFVEAPGAPLSRLIPDNPIASMGVVYSPPPAIPSSPG
jgi:DNA-binding response OmpR family regulator